MLKRLYLFMDLNVFSPCVPHRLISKINQFDAAGKCEGLWLAIQVQTIDSFWTSR